MKGRSFIWRWNTRVLRREWREYVVILVMLATVVAASVVGVLMAQNMTAPPESEYGRGQVAATTTQPNQLEAFLDDQGFAYGTIQTGTVDRDGRVERIAIKSADPANSTVAPLFALVDGAWPTAANEIAVTPQALSDQPPIGTSVSIDGHTVLIVGVVENPTSLSDKFVFASTLTAFPSVADLETSYLIEAPQEKLEGSAPISGLSSTDGGSDRAALTLLVNVVGAFGMLEVALLVGAAFAVIAQRRSRQYGLLAAAGATPKLLRAAATGSGAIVGLIGSVAGLIIGLAVAALLVPVMESAVDHRISFSVPVLAVLPTAILGVAVAALSARRPANALTKRSVVEMLASARPRHTSVARPAWLGVLLTVVGGIALAIGFNNTSDELALIGTVVAPIGLLLLAPLFVRTIGWVVRRMALPERIAGRSIGRYNRRSAAVVAAVALGLAIPMGVSVVTASLGEKAEARGANLADNQLIVWATDMPGGDLPLVPTGVNENGLAAAKDSIATAVPELSFVPLQMAIPNQNEVRNENGHSVTSPYLAAKVAPPPEDECSFCNIDSYGFDGGIDYLASPSWLASPELLSALGLESDWLGSSTMAMASSDQFQVMAPSAGIIADNSVVTVSATWPKNISIPSVLYSPALVKDAQVVTMGWLGTSEAPISDQALATIGDLAPAEADLEFHSPPQGRSMIQAIGIAVGILIGVGITFSAVTLLSTELARDTALLASLGAPPRSSKRIAGAIAGFLAVIGAVLGVVIGYLPMIPMLANPADGFPFVIPWKSIIGLLVVFPLIAAAIGALIGRKPASGLALREFV